MATATKKVSTNPMISSDSPLNTASPLKTDPELKRLLAELPEIKTRRDFTRWRQCFLTRYEYFLGQAGTGEAEPAYKSFCSKLDRWTTLVHQVKDDLNQGKLAISQCAVTARARLANCQSEMVVVTDVLSKLTPSTVEVEKQVGYSKFQLGALLVRNGFAEYQHLAECDELVTKFHSTSPMKEICDRQQLEAFQEFSKKFRIFCDIMADLGLYEAMLKCHEINQLPPEPEPEPEPPAQEPESESESSSSDSEPPPPKPKKKPKEPEPTETRVYKLSFPTLRPPSGPYIKYVETNAKSKDEVPVGVFKRGTLSSSEFAYNHGEDKDSDEGSMNDDLVEFRKPNFAVDYNSSRGSKNNSSSNQDSWQLDMSGKLKKSQEDVDENSSTSSDSTSSSKKKKRAEKKEAKKAAKKQAKLQAKIAEKKKAKAAAKASKVETKELVR